MAGRAGRPGQEEREHDPRREERRRLLRVPLPEDVDPWELDAEVRRDLRSLAKDTAELTAKHLVMAGRLLDEAPEQALAHARAATALAGRVGVVREACGLAAYAAGEWALALSELRTARRVTGRADNLAVLADCERALGRPERALAVLDDPDVPRLEQSARVELVIVVAGARRDLGQADAAVLLLQGPASATKERHPWASRLWYAYADALADAGRPEARDWFARAADVDEDGHTGALDRLLELDGVVFEEEADELGGPEGDEPSVSLADLGLDPVTPADLPAPAGATAPSRVVVPAAVGLDAGPPPGQDDEAPPTDEEAPGSGAAASAVPPAPEAVAPAVFSHEEEPAQVVTPQEPPAGPQVGQQDLFSDLEEP